MTRISATTGNSNLKVGSTDLKLGIVNHLGVFVIRELHRQPGGAYLDVCRQRLPATTMGANAGVLGDWVVRDIDVPDKSIVFVSFWLKSVSMPFKKMLTFAFEVAEENPYVQITFPVVVDRYSTLHELPVSGRFRLLSVEEITKDFAENVKIENSAMHTAAIKTLEDLSEQGILNYWATLTKHSNAEGSVFLAVSGSGPHEEYRINVKYMLPANTENTVKPAGKVIKTASGRKVTIAGRKRRILLS